MKIQPILILVGVICLTGCATPIPMSGTTVAQGRLKSDVFRMLPAYAAAATGCKEKITHIHTEVVQAPDAIQSNNRGQVTQGTIQERWLLTLCGNQEPLYIMPVGRK